MISGNSDVGVQIVDANNFFGVTGPSDQNVIEGNYIGVAASGTTALANSSDGVQIEGIATMAYTMGPGFSSRWRLRNRECRSPAT